MCQKVNYCNRKIDECLVKTIERINKLTPFKTLACCCGHGKYPMTIVIKDKKGNFFELISRISLKPRKRNRFYKKDEQGYYYIPEVQHLNDIFDYLDSFCDEIEPIIMDPNFSDRNKLWNIEDFLKEFKEEMIG